MNNDSELCDRPQAPGGGEVGQREPGEAVRDQNQSSSELNGGFGRGWLVAIIVILPRMVVYSLRVHENLKHDMNQTD